MNSPPRGTVTFLFTDVEGSTKLLHALGRERYGATLREHRRLLREVWQRRGGYEVDTEGDAFFVAFAQASEAVAAAADGQRALAAASWPHGHTVRVRIGIHSGEASEQDGTYLGVAVHRAARIAAAAHGGQVLVSEATRALCADEDVAGVTYRDLGPHRLKDLTEPQRLYQLAIDGFQTDFPAPKTLENRPTNLPSQPTPLIGRERELAELQAILAREDVRLITLTGPGGTGKTRLALQLAADLIEEFPEGVFFVTLAAVTDPGLVIPTVAQTLGVAEQAAESIAQTLAESIREKRMLVVIDNFEQVIDAAADLASVMAGTEKPKLVVTSRSRLQLSSEHEYPVQSLPTAEAVTLFVERAQAVKPTFSLDGNRPVVTEICARLDNLPLAIELAAARIKLLPEQALLQRLDQRLKLLTGGARDLDERQRTLRSTIEWSYGLLDDQEQRLFRRLAVFAGGRTLEAVETVCDAEGDLGIDSLDGLASLIDKSLVRQEEGVDGEPRFVMLETIHEYARDRLAESGEADRLRLRHAAFYRELASRPRADQDAYAWLRRIEPELPNFRLALAAFAESGDVESELALTCDLDHLWYMRGLLEESRLYLERGLIRADGASPRTRARAVDSLGWVAYKQGRFAEALRLATDAADSFGRLGERALLSTSLTLRGLAQTGMADFDAARTSYERALTEAHECGDQSRAAMTLHNLADLALSMGDFEGAQRWSTEAYAAFAAIGDDTGIAISSFNLAHAQFRLGETERALTGAVDLLRVFREGHRDGVVVCLELVGAIAARKGAAEVAARLLGAAEKFLGEIGSAHGPAEADLHERTTALLRRILGEGALSRAWAEGAQLSEEDAVEYALAAAVEVDPGTKV